MKKILSIFAVAILAAGCGSNKPSPGTGPTPTPTPVAQGAAQAAISVTQIRGMHVQAAQTTVKTTSSLTWGSIFNLPRVEAATVTIVTVAQNWEGECSSNPVVGGSSSFVLFGVGQSADPTCSHEFFMNDPDGSQVAATAPSGKAVFGNGTLSNLVVTTERGTVVASPNGVLVSVFIRRGATTLPTGLTCSIPQGGDELACANTATFAALSGDRAVVVLTVGSGDALKNVSAAFTKSLP